jgi:uncharacterized 2Fe-2S/4Fe-4S cluster protein (DUF4445 family)
MHFDIDFQPVGRHTQVKAGTTILEAAQAAGVGLSAICGGGGSCCSCLVRLAPDAPVSPPNSIEQGELDSDELAAGVRLACQVELYGSTRVDVPPESLTAVQRTQVEGEERPVALAAPVVAYDLTLPPATQTDLRADWVRLRDALVSADAPAPSQHPQSHPLHVLKELPTLLRENEWALRVGLREGQVVSLSAPGTPLLGLAVDIGTTKVAGYLVDLISGDTLAMRGLMNPQIAYGEDVMARIAYAIEHESGLQVLQQAIAAALDELARDLCADAGPQGAQPDRPYDPSQIVEAVVVGNTAMHHLFLGLPVRQLGLAPYVAAVSSPLDIKANELGLSLATGATVHLLPNVAGFVGADHVAMLLATGTHLQEGVVISIDIGTNTEITLATHGRLIACSTASGPAFEGAHIRYGMRAADGAIERVRVADSQIDYQTIGDQPPVGICGSGILDAIAQLKLAGVLNHRGAMTKEHPLVRVGENGPEVVIAQASATRHGRDIVLNRKDVSEIQLAKGAIRAGTEILLDHMDLTSDDIDQVIIAGAFGTYIDVAAAVTIGMFPPLPLERFRQVGNAAEPFPVSTQTYPRKQDWLVLNGLAGLAGSLYKFAFDLRLLQSPLFGEWSEPFGARQVGSSAMPFKRNPEHAETLDSLARLVAALPRVAWDNAAHSLLERTLDDSANRRTILPQAFLASDELLRRAGRILRGLVIHPAAVADNLATYGTFAATERLLMVVVRAGADRQVTHEVIREHSMAAWTAIQSGAPNPLPERLATDEWIVQFVAPQQVRALLDARAYVGDAPARAKKMAQLVQERLGADLPESCELSGR